MWLERLILRKTEKRLLPYREQVESLDVDVKDKYKNYLPQIEKCYTLATHWHGTGRYHYQHENGSRYQKENSTETIDILNAILVSDGLIPHHDPWIDSKANTVSLTTTRMHARAFARIHTTQNEELVYELGSIKLWLRFYFALLFIWLFANFWSHRSFIKNTLRTSFSKDIQNWASAIRKPKKGKVIGILDMFKGDIPTSDIEGNYPVLIGIKADSSELIETIPLTNKVEQRSLKPITLEMFSHIEVPLGRVKETEDMLNTYDIDIPVIPLEFGDIYLTNTPLEQLAFHKQKLGCK
jgi:hypothetical protein